MAEDPENEEIVAGLDEIPGVGPVAAAVIVLEIGRDKSRRPTAGHLVSLAKFTFQTKESAGKTKGQRLRRARQPLPGHLGEAAVCAEHVTPSWPGDGLMWLQVGARRAGLQHRGV